jgi:hypothetical protein
MVEKLKEYSESTVTVKTVFLISLLIAALSGGFTMLVNHESRIAKAETSVIELKEITEYNTHLSLAIREDQIAFYRSMNPKWQSSYDPKDILTKREK